MFLLTNKQIYAKLFVVKIAFSLSKLLKKMPYSYMYCSTAFTAHQSLVLIRWYIIWSANTTKTYFDEMRQINKKIWEQSFLNLLTLQLILSYSKAMSYSFKSSHNISDASSWWQWGVRMAVCQKWSMMIWHPEKYETSLVQFNIIFQNIQVGISYYQ